uniref:FBA_2 domain-containing protein n=1 Tax=Caenorhabditis tropicalis TaxID=1561998 RepID=A0A1I7TU06_9PELO
MDTEKIIAYETNFSAEDLNIFLRSWQEGKTNQKLKEIKLETRLETDVKEVLKGCGGELMDPRTSKLKFRYPGGDRYLDLCVHGGIHIKETDRRIAVIGGYLNDEEEEDVPEEEIEEYLNNLSNWNSENEHWYKKTYDLFFF